MDRIRELREELERKTPGHAFTRQALAARLRVTPETLRRWELGLSRPSRRHRIRLAAELGVSVIELEEQR